MNRFQNDRHYYIDVRTKPSSDAISFDLAQHLPRRLEVGPVLVVTDNPQVFLSVIRKRLARLSDDLGRENARTLDHLKKEGLQYEIDRLTNTIFTARGSSRARAKAYVCFVKPAEIAKFAEVYDTIYITLTPGRGVFDWLLHMLRPNGLLVMYGDWNQGYEQMLGKRINQ